MPKWLVTVRDGSGKLEVYPTDAVNYFLFGVAMKSVYDKYQKYTPPTEL